MKPKLRNRSQNLDSSNKKLRSENRKLESEVETLTKLKTKLRNSELVNQAVINKLQRQNKAAENEKVELKDELIICQ